MIRWMRPWEESGPLRFYIMQAALFGYFALWFSHWDFTVYGDLPESAFRYRHEMVDAGWRPPWYYWTTFQWIYTFVPRPSPIFFEWTQYLVVAMSLLGLVGFRAHWMSRLVFLAAIHLVGLFLTVNLQFDGGTSLPLFGMFCLALAEPQAFYQLGKRQAFNQKALHWSWPFYIFAFGVALCYFLAGLFKVLELGWDWPWKLSMDKLVTHQYEQSVFYRSWYFWSPVAILHKTFPWISVLEGFATLIFEMAGVLFITKGHLKRGLAAVLAGFHIMVYFTHGWAYFGFLVALLLVVDWEELLSSRLGGSTN